MLKKGEVLRSKVLEMIKQSVQRNKIGRPTYLNSDEYVLVVASAEIEGAHGLPIAVNTFGVELQLVIRSVNARQSTKYITPKASSHYTCLVIKKVNNIEECHDKQSKKSITGLVKVSSISNNRSEQSDTRLACMMFRKIAQMYRDIRKQESEEATELILNIFANLNSNSTTLSKRIIPKILIQQPTMPLDPKTVSKDLKEIQPCPSQVWNWHYIGFDKMYHGSELSVPTSSSWGNTFGNTKHEIEPNSGVLI